MIKGDIISHYAFPEARIAVVFNSVDLTRFHPHNRLLYRAKRRSGLGVRDDALLLLFAGNNYRLKGLGALVRALSLLARRFPERDFRLLVAGRGRVRPYRRLSRRLGVEDRVIFAGPLTGMEEYYGASDIYVHPTFYDSCSLTVLEALASGLPVVTTRFNGAAQVIVSEEGGAVIDDPADAREPRSRHRPLPGRGQARNRTHCGEVMDGAVPARAERGGDPARLLRRPGRGLRAGAKAPLKDVRLKRGLPQRRLSQGRGQSVSYLFSAV